MPKKTVPLKKMTLKQLYKLRESLDVQAWKVQMVIMERERKLYPEVKVH